MKLIFENPNLDIRIHCSKSGDWEYSEIHKCFIWHGKELTPEEFNEVQQTVFEDARHAWPHGFINVRALGSEVPKSEITVNLDGQLLTERDMWKERAYEMRGVAESSMLQVENLQQSLASVTLPPIARKDPLVAQRERAANARAAKMAKIQ